MPRIMVKHYVVIHGPPGVKEDTLEIKGSMLRDLIEILSQKYGRDFHRLTINSKTGSNSAPNSLCKRISVAITTA